MMNKNKKNIILEGDCLDVMDTIEENSIDLIYLDPPFFTERKHTLTNRERTQKYSFDDIWKNNISYANFLKERLEKMRALLKDEGSIFVHCDKSAEHIIRCVLDSVFGTKNFQSEIIWFYKRWSNSKKGLLPNHQNIYFYSKTSDFKFNTIFTSYSETTNVDQILQIRTRDKTNKSVYALDENGETKLGKEKKGVPLSDVWDIPYLNPKAKERVGYPTQKPLLLLDKIVELVTNKGDLVLDPFCGSGTTCVSAKLLGRNYIGIDQSKDAVELANNRLNTPIKTQSRLLEKGRESYINADSHALNVLDGIDFSPVQRNKGIDAILTQQFQGSPILVKVQKKTETLSEAAELLHKAMRVKKSKKSFLIQTADYLDLLDKNIPTEIKIIPSPAFNIKNSIFS